MERCDPIGAKKGIRGSLRAHLHGEGASERTSIPAADGELLFNASNAIESKEASKSAPLISPPPPSPPPPRLPLKPKTAPPPTTKKQRQPPDRRSSGRVVVGLGPALRRGLAALRGAALVPQSGSFRGGSRRRGRRRGRAAKVLARRRRWRRQEEGKGRCGRGRGCGGRQLLPGFALLAGRRWHAAIRGRWRRRGGRGGRLLLGRRDL